MAGPATTGGSDSVSSEPGRTVIASGGRPTRMPSPISACSIWLRRLGISARSPATSDSCCATSSALAVPASSRPRITASVCSASARLRCATTRRSASASAVNQVFATLVTTGQRDHLLVEAAEHRAGHGGLPGGAVLAPEVHLVGDVQRADAVVVDVDRDGRAAAARDPGEPPVRADLLPAGAGGGGHGRQQRRAGDADLGVRLAHPGDRRGDVEILHPRLLDQRRPARASGSRATSPRTARLPRRCRRWRGTPPASPPAGRR